MLANGGQPPVPRRVATQVFQMRSCSGMRFFLAIALGALGRSAGAQPDTASTPAAVRAAPAAVGPTWKQTRRNAVVLSGVGAASLVVIWLLPEDISQWSAEQKTLRHWKKAYTMPPVWDKDPVVFNYVLHPLMGMYTYQMERSQGAGQWRSFLFATAASVAWEYVFEAPVERPSATDLLTTSPPGWVLGELGHRLTMRLRRGGWSGWEKAVAVVVDPAWVLQRGFR